MFLFLLIYISQLSISLSLGTSTLWVTFAFGAFLAPPLEPASDQAVIGAQTLCAVGEQGHDLVHTTRNSTKWLPNSG